MAVTVTTYPTTDATSYASVADLQAWAAQRLKDVSGKTTDQLGAAVNAASEYMDVRFRFRGVREDHTQAREWPRDFVYDERGYRIDAVPQEVKDACCAYAFLVLGGAELLSAPDRDSSGRSLKMKREKVGPIEEQVEYVEAGGFELPMYPAIDRLLYRRDLVVRQGGIGVGCVGRA